MKARSAGYTLVEIMVVILVIGLAVSLTALSLHGSDRRDQEDMDRLLDFLQQAREAAVFGNVVVAVSCAPDEKKALSCHRTRWQDNAWSDDPVTLPMRDGWAREVNEGDTQSDIKSPQWLTVRFYPAGEMTPLAVHWYRVSNPKAQWFISGEDVAGLKLERMDARP